MIPIIYHEIVTGDSRLSQSPAGKANNGDNRVTDENVRDHFTTENIPYLMHSTDAGPARRSDYSLPSRVCQGFLLPRRFPLRDQAALLCFRQT